MQPLARVVATVSCRESRGLHLPVERINTIGIITILANYRGEDADDCNIEQFKWYTFVNTPSHGYLCIGSDENGYSDAVAIARRSNYSFMLDGGLVYLEEDADAPAFLKAMGLL